MTDQRTPPIAREAQARLPMERRRFELKTDLNIGDKADAYLLNADGTLAQRVVLGVAEHIVFEVEDTLHRWEGYGRDSVDPGHQERGMQGRATRWSDSGLWEIDYMECP